VANTYILLEASDGLILIDQHAVHERVVFQRLSAETARQQGQRLTRSVVLELMPAQAAILRRRIDLLAEAGFAVEPFGGNSFVIHSIPAIVGTQAPDELIRNFIETTHEDEAAPRPQLLAALAKTAACHSAIRAGQKLHPEEIRHLLEEIDLSHIASTCPHGRPWWHKITTTEMARFFQRT
jgi:DNA mismatch repair protein MutL